MSRILVIDDDGSARASLARVFTAESHDVLLAESIADAQDRHLNDLFIGGIDCIFCDVRMPGQSGLEWFSEWSADPAVDLNGNHGVRIPVVLMTAFGEVKDAVWAMKRGAVDFLIKPFGRKEVLKALEVALKRGDLRKRQRSVAGVGSDFLGFERSILMKTVADQARRAAQVDSNVILSGESGTGKSWLARQIHQISPRSPHPFVEINCSAIPAALIESELFGHEKGAFTGATQTHRGLFESVGEGTLFLDEIGDAPLEFQPKLLKAIEEKQFRRVGGVESHPFQGRIISATHQDIPQRIRLGEFRSDLWYRLQVIEIHMPALREHLEDLPDLAQKFLEMVCLQTGLQKHFLPGVIEHLVSYPWPGNIRELKNAIERAVVLSQGETINQDDFPVFLGSQTPLLKDFYGKTLNEVQSLMFESVLQQTGGDRAEAARKLGVTERTIYRWLKEESHRR